MTEKRQYKELVSGLSAIPSVRVDDNEFSGSYLAMLVATNPNQAMEEAARTPQLLAELGRIVARAHAVKNKAEADYRIWRDGMIHRVTNHLDFAIEHEFDCAANPGVDSRGKDKAAKCPGVGAAEIWVRTLAPYFDHYDSIIQAEEAWATLHAALDAARQRTWVIRNFDDNQDAPDVSARRRIEHVEDDRRSAPPPPPQVNRS